MGNDAKRTPGKWWAERGNGTSSIHAPDMGDRPFDDLIAFTYHEHAAANAAFIVQACNSHDALVAACEAVDTLLNALTVNGIEPPEVIKPLWIAVHLQVQAAIGEAKGANDGNA